jgi:outer membrane receptor protein involved in Fe transport
VYYIDWDHIQITELDPNPAYPPAAFNTNGSRAKSEGVELSVNARPLRGLEIATWVAYNNAVLTEPFPAGSTVLGSDGSRLPYAARWTGNVSLNQAFPITQTVSGYAGAQVSYVGDREGLFLPSNIPPPRQVYPSYTQLNLRTGLKLDSWTVNLYANNVTDKRGQLGGGIGDSPPQPFTLRYITPRVVGLSVGKKF